MCVETLRGEIRKQGFKKVGTVFVTVFLEMLPRMRLAAMARGWVWIARLCEECVVKGIGHVGRYYLPSWVERQICLRVLSVKPAGVRRRGMIR